MIKKLTGILLYLFFVLYPFGLLFRIKVFQNVWIIPQDFVVLLLFILSVIYFIRKKRIPMERNVFFFFASFSILGFLSLIINALLFKDINLAVSFLYISRYIIYGSLLFISNIYKGSKKIGRLLTSSGAVIVAIGYIQYFFYNNLSYLKFLGWDDHLYRLFSTFFDPNYVGVFYVLYFFYLLGIVLNRKIRESLFEIIALFFTFIAIYLTYSRTAFVSLLIGIITLMFLLKKVKVMIAVLLISVIVMGFFSDVKVEGLNPFRTFSSSERIKSAKNALNIFEKNPIIGVGFNSYRDAQIRYGFRNKIGASISNADAGTDNSYLFVLATTGIIGFFMYVCGYFFIIKEVLNKRSIIRFALFSSFMGLFAGSLFLNCLFYTPIISWVFLLVSFREQLD